MRFSYTAMKRIFMILTSHRLDCFRLAMDLLDRTGSLKQFDRVVLMLNGVVGKHRQYIDEFMAARPEIPWDTISGPRGKGPLVANLQNECVRRYPDSLYFKIDEDLFVSPGWVDKLTAAYELHKNDPHLALITPVIPNNGIGFHHLLNRFSALREEYGRLFTAPVVPDCNGPVWINPYIAEWLIRKFIDMEQANHELESRQPVVYERFAIRFSINCLVYDYRHWQEMGGIPGDEEPAWGQWIPDHGKFNVLATNTLVQHYSFFVQQDWIDRSSVLEDLRAVNLPDTLSRRDWMNYNGPRWGRILQQVPAALRRRMARLTGSGAS